MPLPSNRRDRQISTLGCNESFNDYCSQMVIWQEDSHIGFDFEQDFREFCRLKLGEAACVSPAARLQNKGSSGYLVGHMHLLKNNMKLKIWVLMALFPWHLVLPELQLSLQKRLMNGDHVRREDDKLAGPREMAPVSKHPSPAPSSSLIWNGSGKRTHIRARSVSGSSVVRIHLGFFLLSP